MNNIKKLWTQAIQFIGLSGIGWLLDFLTYTGLSTITKRPEMSNVISSWVGVTFVFLFATHKVFQNKSKISLKWKYIIYLLYQVILISFISMLLGTVNEMIVEYVQIEVIKNFSAIIAKIFVTPITMILNFCVMKSVIEKI